jgi:hypothetical protein
VGTTSFLYFQPTDSGESVVGHNSVLVLPTCGLRGSVLGTLCSIFFQPTDSWEFAVGHYVVLSLLPRSSTDDVLFPARR